MVNKFTLKSGREIKYEKPNFWQRAEIIDLALEYFNRKIPMSLMVCGKIALYCKIATEKQLNNDEFTDTELYEIGGTLLEQFYDTELNKKKLK